MSIQPRPRRLLATRQHGQAMLLMVLLLGVGAGAVIFTLATPARTAIENDKKTAAALAQARDALIGYAASDPNQPGVLPCPDLDNDGSADAPCGVAGVTSIGRLPWKTLGLPELRDGSGECLWYAVSANFKNSGVSGPAILNSDSAGTLTVVDSTGSSVLAPPNAALAIVFAPGIALPGQDRTPGAASICGGNTTAANYLDTYTVAAINYNNANGTAGTNRFITSAPSATSSQLNDTLLLITSDALFNVVNVRVAKEAIAALEAYRGPPGNNGYYPFANDYPSGAPYSCSAGLNRGRFPATTAGCGQAAWGGALPAWFATNNWSLVTHYAMSKSCGELTGPLAILGPLLCGLATAIPGLAPLLALLGFADDPIVVAGVTNADGARALVIVTARATGVQVHPCTTAVNCLEDNQNWDGDATYIKPSRFPASNDRMAICDSTGPCPIVP